MTETWKVEVPTGLSGSGGSSYTGEGSAAGADTDKSLKDLLKGVKKLDKTMYLNLDIKEMLTSVLGDVFKVISPLFKLLSILLLVIFKPLMPLLKILMEGLAWLVKLFNGDAADIGTFIGKMLLAILLIIVAIFFAPVGAAIALLVIAIALMWDYLVAAGLAIWEAIKWVGEKLADYFIWLWELWKGVFIWLKDMFMSIWTDYIKPAWDWLKDVGKWIWEKILKPAWDYLSDVGTKVWNLIKTPFERLAGKVNKIVSWIIDKLPSWITGERAKGGPVSSSGTYLVGEKGPELFSPGTSGNITPNDKMGGGTTININGPVVREDRDIKRIASEVSKVIERKLWRSY